MTREARRKAGLFPSRDVDVATALQLLSWSWYRFARSTEALDAARIEQVLASLPGWLAGAAPPEPPERRRAAGVFLQVAVDTSSPERTRATWRAAVNALKALESQYAFGSKQKATQLRALAADARVLEACRATAVASTDLPLELLAVLAIDGSEASGDALMPHVQRALEQPLQLTRFEDLARYAAPTPTMDALFAVVNGRMEASRRASPVLELARTLGLASTGRFRVDLRVAGPPRAELQLSLDSQRPGPAFTGWLFLREPLERLPLHRDDGSTACALEDLPTFLAAQAQAHGVRWAFTEARATHLRGQRLERFLGWLAGTAG